MEVNNRQHCREKKCQLTKNLAFATTRNYNYRLCKTIRFYMATFIYCDFIAYFGRAGDFSRQFYLTNSTSWIAVEVNNRQHCREKKCQLTKNLAFATTRNYNYRLCKTIRFYMATFIYCDFIAYFGRAGDFSRQFYLTNSTSWIAVEVNNRQHCREKKCQLTKNLAFATTRNYNYRLCKTIRFYMATFIYCDFIAYFGRAGDFSRQFYLTNSTSWIAVEVNNRQHCREKKCQLTKNLAFATTRNYNYRLCKTIRFYMATFIYCDFIAYFGRAGDFSRQFYLTNSTSWIAVEVNNRQHCREKNLTRSVFF